MRADDLCDIFGEMDEKYVEEVRAARHKRSRWPKVLSAAACLVLALIAGALLYLPDRSAIPSTDPTSPTASTEPPAENALRFNMVYLEAQEPEIDILDPIFPPVWNGPGTPEEAFEQQTGKDLEAFRDQVGTPWVFKNFGLTVPVSGSSDPLELTFTYQCEALGEASVGVSVCDPGLTDPPQPFDCDDPFVSTVNGVKIMLYHVQTQDGLNFNRAYFYLDGLSYCVAMDTNDLAAWEQFLSFLTEA